MSRLLRLTGKQMVGVLQEAGFQVIRNRGSHRFLRHPDGRSTVVPIHAGETLGTGLLRKIPTQRGPTGRAAMTVQNSDYAA